MNEGQVHVAGRTLEIGRLRSLVSLAGGLALGCGLAVGVASAAPGGGPPDITGLPAAQRAPQTSPAARPAARPPLHQLLFSRTVGDAQRGQRIGRIAAGRVTEIDGNAVTIAVAGGQTRVVRVLPQTKAPAQPTRSGDLLVAIGRPEPDGSLTARAVTVRRPGQLSRRQAATTTSEQHVA
ncbi:MAG: hypothetical protein ACR2NO_07215 [Chloroflexota bacterium]